MLITSHLVVTIFLAKQLLLSESEFIMALGAGVLVDADHFFVNRKWVSDIKNFLTQGVITHGEIKQHSWFQEVLFGMTVAILVGLIVLNFSPTIRWWIVPLFLGVHMLLDSVMRYEHEPFIPFSKWNYHGWMRSGTLIELLFSLALLFTALFLV